MSRQFATAPDTENGILLFFGQLGLLFSVCGFFFFLGGGVSLSWWSMFLLDMLVFCPCFSLGLVTHYFESLCLIPAFRILFFCHCSLGILSTRGLLQLQSITDLQPV